MLHRHLSQFLLDALRDTPVVYLQGGRQTGKSTLVQEIARGPHRATYYSLDSAAVLAAAFEDPEGFIAGLEGPVVIDEVQRAPELAIAIKSAVDRDRTPGRFLLTGSASVLTLPCVADSLAGRVELHTLWPFSQGEIESRRESFLQRAFAGKVTAGLEAASTKHNLIDRVLTGGFPEVRTRTSADRRGAWFESYITTILQRDVRDISNIENLSAVPRLLSLLASRVCSLLNCADVARSLRMPQSTLKRYLALLEATFLVRLLPAWNTNLGKRLVKSPKLLLSDTGLAAHLLGLDLENAAENPTLFGHVLENFVAMELVKQLSWSGTGSRLFHFRTSSGGEVDLVVEDRSGGLVGIEVKSSAKVEKKDFSGLRLLAEMTGERFRQGCVLYRGKDVVPFERDLYAVPVEWLWV